MKILTVCSVNSGKIAPFVIEQAATLKEKGCEMDFFTVEGKGIRGYLRNREKLNRKINEFHPDIIHAHYGLSGLLANLQRKIPVITTYHGSDINDRKILRLSKIVIFLSRFNIFVSQKNIDIAKPKKNYALIPCGVNIDIFKPLNRNECRNKLGFGEEEKLILFSSSFDNRVKNPALAKEAVELLKNTRLIELKGYGRQQVCELMNAVDAVLMTSFTEGSPQFVKEAMACNCPIVSTDAGDVKKLIFDVEGCFICPFSAKEIAEALQTVFFLNKKTAGRNKILNLDNQQIAEKIMNIYRNVVPDRHSVG
ncbi:MAG: glycosyltransferase [Prevotellaceae bacterium]|jgi:glycosyltransferase involved in cell wall biosynthesis|nr:glycosyltransferase [Prevotellaceae bacterium]